MGWGTFFGSAAKTGLDTYERLGEEELRELQRKEIKRQIAEREALDAAYKNTIGKQDTVTDYIGAVQQGTGVGSEQAQALKAQLGDVDPQFATADAEAIRGGAVRALPKPEKDKSGYAPPAPTAAIPEKFKYSQEQAIRDYQNKAAGISREGALQALQIGQVSREEKAQQRWADNFTSTLSKWSHAVDSGNIKAIQDLGKEYGLTITPKEHKDSKAITYTVTDKSGKVLHKDLPRESLGELGSQAFTMHMLENSGKYFANPRDAMNFAVNLERLGIAREDSESLRALRKSQGRYYDSGGGRAQRLTIPQLIKEVSESLVGQPKVGAKPDAKGNYTPDQRYTKEEATIAATQFVFKSPTPADDKATVESYLQDVKDLQLKYKNKGGISSPKFKAELQELEQFYIRHFGYVPRGMSRNPGDSPAAEMIQNSVGPNRKPPAAPAALPGPLPIDPMDRENTYPLGIPAPY